jgi:hypothetical protein
MTLKDAHFMKGITFKHYTFQLKVIVFPHEIFTTYCNL